MNNIIRPIYYYYDTSPIIQWRNIGEIFPGIDCNRYLVSTHGDIYDQYTNAPVKEYQDKNGYKTFSANILNGDNVKIRSHRAVLFTFNYVPGCENLQVNHKDGITYHNWLTNLEWVTTRENGLHAVRTGLHEMYGENNPNNKLTRQQVEEICKLIETGQYWDIEIAEMYGVSYANISDIHKGKIWKNVSQFYDMTKRKPAKKFLKSDIELICQDIQSGNYSYSMIANKYSTTLTEIYDILSGKIHSDVSCKYDLTTPQGNKAVDKITARQICELIQTGEYSLGQIANTCSVSTYVVRKIKEGTIYPDLSNEYDLSVPYYNTSRTLSEETVVKICEMINEGKGNSEIGLLLNISPAIISNIKQRTSYAQISKDILK